MKVYTVFVDHTYDKELLYIFETKEDAEAARETEQENCDASGLFSEIVVEEWEVY